MAKDLGQRVAALSLAHDLVRPSVTGALRLGRPKGVELATLARIILAAHGDGRPGSASWFAGRRRWSARRPRRDWP